MEKTYETYTGEWFLMAGQVYVKVGGVWKEADNYYVKVGGVWKTGTEIHA